MTLENQRAVVTGGSRGLGLGAVEALVEAGADVTVVARTEQDLDAVSKRLGVSTISADVGDAEAAHRILSDVKPTILLLNAGAAPSMALLDEQTWETFSATWETDVKGGLHWIQAALATPLAPGSRVLVSSSGAAINGSPMSGGYAGAKRMLWLLANYADRLAADRALGIRFQTVVPRQMVAGTGIGDAASSAYSRKLGLSMEDYLARFGAPLPPREFGKYVVEVLTSAEYKEQRAFGIKGDGGISILEEAA